MPFNSTNITFQPDRHRLSTQPLLLFNPAAVLLTHEHHCRSAPRSIPFFNLIALILITLCNRPRHPTRLPSTSSLAVAVIFNPVAVFIATRVDLPLRTCVMRRLDAQEIANCPSQICVYRQQCSCLAAGVDLGCMRLGLRAWFPCALCFYLIIIVHSIK